MKEELNIKGVSTSNATTELSNSLNIPLISINKVHEIDLTIDGADEVDKIFFDLYLEKVTNSVGADEDLKLITEL
jgi:ribose 5-phosphate isomerase